MQKLKIILREMLILLHFDITKILNTIDLQEKYFNNIFKSTAIALISAAIKEKY